MKYLKHKFITSVFLFHITCVNAQDYVARAKIRSVNDSGFYKILLTPEDKQFARPDLGNLRIKDGQGREIPYIIEYGTKTNELVAIEDFRHKTVHDTVLKKTVIDVAFRYPIQASQMRMDIAAPVFYKREAGIWYMEEAFPISCTMTYCYILKKKARTTLNLNR